MDAQDSRKRTYEAAEAEARLKAELPQWAYRDGRLCRTYRTHGWKSSLMAAGAIGHLAEAAWHHPDLLVRYDSVGVRLMSHDAQGITERDFALARRIEELLMWRPGEEAGPFQGTPQEPRYAYMKYD